MRNLAGLKVVRGTMRKNLVAVVTILGVVLAVERFYTHPTYGNGLRALLAAIPASRFFA